MKSDIYKRWIRYVKGVNWVSQPTKVSIITTTNRLCRVSPQSLVDSKDWKVESVSRKRGFYIFLALFVTGGVTETLFEYQQQEVKQLKVLNQELERNYKEILRSVLSCTNEGGFDISFTGGGRLMDSATIVCKRTAEWRNGEYYHYINGKPIKNGHLIRSFASGISPQASTGR